MTAKNDITGDTIATRAPSESYASGYDRIWGKSIEKHTRCKTHPDAPHGFLRNDSHSQGRYVCECEYWSPEDAS